MRKFFRKKFFSYKQFFSYKGLRKLYYQKLIFPIYGSKKPITEISLGVSVGVFWGMTPTVGAQMYIVFLQWLLFRVFTNSRFDLTLAIAMVWISNPLTVVPLYFLFHTTGKFLIDLFQLPISDSRNFVVFLQEFNAIYANEYIGFFQKSKAMLGLLFSSWGVSLMLGSIIYAVSSAVASYYLTAKILAPLIEKRRLKKTEKRSRLARNLLLQGVIDRKEIAVFSSLTEKKRLKQVKKQKKFVKNQISKDLKEIEDVTD